MKDKHLQETLDALAAEWNLNGTVCVTVNGEKAACGAYGLCERESGKPFTPDTRCYIASVTKQFTAVCLLMLAEEGKVCIDDKLSKYLPEYSHAEEVTLRQMLNMTSGIRHELAVLGEIAEAEADRLGLPEAEGELYVSKACAPEKCTYEDFLALMNPLPLIFEPGSRFDYSDTNYMMLGHIVEILSGKTLADFMAERIFRPLGMSHTVLGAEYSEGPSYLYLDGRYVNAGKAHFTTGEGSIATTASDLCIWLNAVLDGRFISEEHWKECFTPVNGYGFGWEMSDGRLCHGGGDLGYQSFVALDREKRTAFALAGCTRLRTDDGKTLGDFLKILFTATENR